MPSDVASKHPDLDMAAEAAHQLAALLSKQQMRIVFAESCTAGLASATLAQVPGISQWHCGSAVTYRETTKTQWLHIPPEDIELYNVVSREIAAQMALGVLKITPEADIAAAITGHLGPDAPAEFDGVAFVAIARRTSGETKSIIQQRFQLEAAERTARQYEAAVKLLNLVSSVISDSSGN